MIPSTIMMIPLISAHYDTTEGSHYSRLPKLLSLLKKSPIFQGLVTYGASELGCV